jgi:hypothetical protein
MTPRLPLALTVLLLPALARAEPPAHQEPIVYSFEDELVHGDLVRPDVEVLAARKRAARATLIAPRTSFVRELAKSIEDL